MIENIKLRHNSNEDGNIEESKSQMLSWIKNFQKRFCKSLELLERSYNSTHSIPGRFMFKNWSRGEDVGGGTMGILKGSLFEKAGVNISSVHGEFSPEFRKEIDGAQDDPRFWACGLSIVVYPFNPYVPNIHYNARIIQTTKFWFGGGVDLTPTFSFEEDTKEFHSALKEPCEKYEAGSYEKFKKSCDDYFFIKHRNEPRGVGGIFFDNLNSGSFEHDMEFLSNYTEAVLYIYPQIVKRRMYTHWSAEDKYQQLLKRGKYAEFNLIYDRGVRFGLETNGNIDAIFMCLPPAAGWE